MSNSIVDEWLQFAKMDYDTARYLYETMRPKPLEIICYHCQQAVEQMVLFRKWVTDTLVL